MNGLSTMPKSSISELSDFAEVKDTMEVCSSLTPKYSLFALVKPTNSPLLFLTQVFFQIQELQLLGP